MSTENRSVAMAFLEDVIGGPLTLGDLLLSIRLGEEMSQAAFASFLETALGQGTKSLRDMFRAYH